jgi:hypothetical protein
MIVIISVITPLQARREPKVLQYTHTLCPIHHTGKKRAKGAAVKGLVSEEEKKVIKQCRYSIAVINQSVSEEEKKVINQWLMSADVSAVA